MGLFSELMGNASEVDASQLNEELGPILADNESVELGFKMIRDLFVFTNKRLVLVDKQGITGSKVEFLSIPYKSIARFAVETTGTFDSDSELRIWVGSDPNPIEKELDGSADIAAIQKKLANCIFS